MRGYVPLSRRCLREVRRRIRAPRFTHADVRVGRQPPASIRRFHLVATVMPHPDVCPAFEEGDVQPPQHPSRCAVLTLAQAGVGPIPTGLRNGWRLVPARREDVAASVHLVAAELLLSRQCGISWRCRQAPEAPGPRRRWSHEADGSARRASWVGMPIAADRGGHTGVTFSAWRARGLPAPYSLYSPAPLPLSW